MERRITIEEEKIYCEDYQMRMLQVNRIEGLLSVKGRGSDGKSFYDYDVSGKISMKAMYEKKALSGEAIRAFLKRFLEVIKETEKYLLDIHHILLRPEYIYFEEGKYYFCYYPPGGASLWEEFHRLTEYFVKQADYKDRDCVQMIFILHKETLEENYSLEKLAARCLEKEEEEEPETVEAEYERPGRDWITEQEMGNIIMEETENMWMPVKRFLARHRKPKWGNWDGLYIEEEEL